MTQVELDFWSMVLVADEDEREQTDSEREQDEDDAHRDFLYDEAKDNERAGEW